MSTMITRDEWLAEFERVATIGADDDGLGMTTEELGGGKHSAQWVQARLRALVPRLIVTKRRGVAIDGRTTYTPCYRLKPEA